jgi:hypothetical protein
MAEKDERAAGPEAKFGSPEDLQMTIRVLSEFFTKKLKAAELFSKRGSVQEPSTGSTKSICHIDGKTDGDEGWA